LLTVATVNYCQTFAINEPLVADPDIRLGGHGSIHSAWEGKFNNYVPSISRLFLRWRGGPKSVAKLLSDGFNMAAIGNLSDEEP